MRLLRHEAQLAASLMSLLPDAVDAASSSPIDERPGVWILAGESLYEIDVGHYVVPPANDPATEITCRRRALDSSQAAVSVRERIAAHRGGGIVRSRRWEFVVAPSDDAVVIESEQTMRGGFESDRAASLEEQFARALARALGFAIPDEDVGQQAY